MERPIADGGDRVWNCDACQAFAVAESLCTNGRHGVRNGDTRQAVESIECVVANGSDGIRDDRVFTTRDQRIACRLNNGIAIITGIVVGIPTFHGKARQTIASRERPIADESDGIRDGHACQAIAVKKRKPADGRDCVGDGDAGQFPIVLERSWADGSDGVSGAVIGNGGGDGNARQAVVLGGWSCDFDSVFTINIVIIQAVDLEVIVGSIGTEGSSWHQQRQHQQCGSNQAFHFPL